MFTKILNSPNELKDGDVITGARVNYIKYKNDQDSWVRWHDVVVGTKSFSKERLIRNYHMCQFRVVRHVSESSEIVYTYVKGQGWVPYVD